MMLDQITSGCIYYYDVKEDFSGYKYDKIE